MTCNAPFLSVKMCNTTSRAHQQCWLEGSGSSWVLEVHPSTVIFGDGEIIQAILIQICNRTSPRSMRFQIITWQVEPGVAWSSIEMLLSLTTARSGLPSLLRSLTATS